MQRIKSGDKVALRIDASGYRAGTLGTATRVYDTCVYLDMSNGMGGAARDEIVVAPSDVEPVLLSMLG
jgi:hypothetical protein